MALITTIRDLHRRKGRERRGLALAEGVRLVEEMVAVGARCKGVAWSPALESTTRGSALRAVLLDRGIPMHECEDDELAKVAATDQPQGVIAVYEPRQWSLPDLLPTLARVLVVLDAVQDPGNVGTIARTAVAFGASGLLALPGTADLTNPKVVRASMGALFRLPHCAATTDDLNAMVRGAGGEVWVAAMRGEKVGSSAPAGPVAIVFGNEGAGVSDDVVAAASRNVAIPIDAGAESLNVAVAAGIILHALSGGNRNG
ncbi:MAG: RNA methyltransferase [Gemmatimonadales bacterium]